MKQILLALCVLAFSCSPKTEQPVVQKRTQVTFDTIGYSLTALEPLHERITLKRQDKSLVEYINSNPNKVDSVRKVVYLQPFGNMKPEVEAIIKSEVEYLSLFLQIEVKVLNRIPYDSIKKIDAVKTRMVPTSDFDYYSGKKGGTPNLREQIQASSFMDIVLKHRKPKDAIAVLGITEHDIYNPNFNFLFGISSAYDKVGLVSTFRLIDYGNQTKYNIRKVVSKQIVNIFSISNVKDYTCVLNYHDNYDQLAGGTFHISPVALSKLKYAVGFEYEKRCKDLMEFWKKEQNPKVEKYYSDCLTLIKKQNTSTE